MYYNYLSFAVTALMSIYVFGGAYILSQQFKDGHLRFINVLHFITGILLYIIITIVLDIKRKLDDN